MPWSRSLARQADAWPDTYQPVDYWPEFGAHVPPAPFVPARQSPGIDGPVGGTGRGKYKKPVQVATFPLEGHDQPLGWKPKDMGFKPKRRGNPFRPMKGFRP